MAKRTCRTCGRDCNNPQTIDRLNLERRRGKRGQLLKGRMVPRKGTQCGLCFALDYLRDDRTEDGMTLYSELRDMATAELGGAGHAYRGAERTPRTPMDSDTATTFQDVDLVAAELAEAGCDAGCLAYVDIFTYKRWRAQGFQVERGQHGTRTGKATVFCKHQVEPIKTAEVAA